MGTRDEIVTALDDDGATYEDRDGRTWRLDIQPDKDMSVMDDGDWYGALEWSGRPNAYGWPTRPDGMNGSAKIITRDRGDALWWQPPADVTDLAGLERVLRDLLEYGYVGVVVETDDGHTASLWGVETFPDAACIADIVGELVDEIRGAITRAEIKRVRATFGLLDAVR